MQQSDSITGVTTKETMASMRLVCEKEIDVQRQRIDSFMAVPFRRSMDSAVEPAEAAVEGQVELAKMKAELREAEDDFVKVLAVKTRKEARQMGIWDSISATKSRTEELKRVLQLQRSKRDEYAAFISQQSRALAMSKDNANEGIKDKADIQEAILWYNRVLGFRVEAGHGVKFTFTNIDANNPEGEFWFTVHYGNDIYKVLDCNPQLNDIKELVQELNDTNDLFRFVRLMREKFREATLPALLAHSENLQQESTVVSVSAPMSSVSPDTGMSTPENNVSRVLREVNRQHKKANHGAQSKSPIVSPMSTSSCRRSSRLKGKK